MDLTEMCCCDSRFDPGTIGFTSDPKVEPRDRKYIFSTETKELNGHTLHRIQAVRDFGFISKGNLGGWIETEENLSHFGECWVNGDSCVYEDARVCENATVFTNATIFEKAIIAGRASICDNAAIYGTAKIYGKAWIFGTAKVFDQARICDGVYVSDRAKIYGHAFLKGSTNIHGNANICGAFTLDGKINIYSGKITSEDQYFLAGPIGSRNDYTTFFLDNNEILVSCGYFVGTIQEFEQAVKIKHGSNKYANDYFNLIRFVKERFKSHVYYRNTERG